MEVVSIRKPFLYTFYDNPENVYAAIIKKCKDKIKDNSKITPLKTKCVPCRTNIIEPAGFYILPPINESEPHIICEKCAESPLNFPAKYYLVNLQSCRFCGGTALAWEHDCGEGYEYVYIQCMQCDVRFEEQAGDGMLAILVKKWNNRV